MMMTLMSRFVMKQHEIFKSVIIFNSVNMMNTLRFKQISSYVFFHYQTMFKHISMTIGKGMDGNVNFYIPAFMYFSATSPRRIFTPRKSVGTFLPMFKCKLNSRFSSFIKFNNIGAFFTLIPRRLRSFIYTLWHGVLQLKGAAFGGLSKTVKSLHLLTARVLDTKILPLISTYNFTRTSPLCQGAI